MIAVTACAIAIAGGLSLASSSCSYGSYDGSSDAGPASTGASVSAAFLPGKEQTVRTEDGTLSLQVPATAFAAPTTIQIEQLANRDADGLTVPAFLVTSDTPLVGRVAVTFTGNSSGGSGSASSGRLVVTLDVEGGAPTPLLVGGNGSGGGSGGGSGQACCSSVFGIATSLGVFSIASRQGRTFRVNQGAGATCVERCCAQGPNGGNAVAIGTSCQCDLGVGGGGPSTNLTCFLQCADVAVTAELCGTYAASVATNITCGPPDAGDLGRFTRV